MGLPPSLDEVFEDRHGSSAEGEGQERHEVNGTVAKVFGAGADFLPPAITGTMVTSTLENKAFFMVMLGWPFYFILFLAFSPNSLYI